MAGGIAFKDSHLAVVHFTNSAAVLALNPDRVLSFFDKCRFIVHEYPLGISHVLMDQGVVLRKNLVLIPESIGNGTFHPSGISPFDVKGNRLDRFSLKIAQLAHHVSEEVLPGLTLRKSVMERSVEFFQLVHKSGDINLFNLILWNGIEALIASDLGQHNRPPCNDILLPWLIIALRAACFKP
ncbi:hypothetical protein DSTSK_18770 [Desulforhabdus sp. TSK]|nr:hypothetical protein DSTSK_18770 [Desulforhabdus sp. TSK]